MQPFLQKHDQVRNYSEGFWVGGYRWDTCVNVQHWQLVQQQFVKVAL
jgi:hypothetical protein